MRNGADPTARNVAEQKIQQALAYLTEELRTGKKANISHASRLFGCPFTTLRCRWNGDRRSLKEANEGKQLLSPSQEAAIVLWLEMLGDEGTPICKRIIKKRVEIICSKRPSKNWIYTFLQRNPSIVLAKSSGLDYNRAKAFNRPVVERYLDELHRLVEKHDIPIENVYNMDEKGCQRGGGKKGTTRKYFYGRRLRAKYKHRSGNLELVTIIEAICADGTHLKPGFIFPGSGNVCRAWFEVDNEIRYSTYSILINHTAFYADCAL